jgi:conjugal transfer pilin signal peptidase TrbI
LTFVKMVKGVPGDVVTREGRDYYINGVKVATAKEFSLKGEPLELGPTGIIPAGRYFVWTPHKDSLDSRYGRAGWISQDDVIGRAKPLL